MTLTEETKSDAGTVERTEEFYYNESQQLTRRVTKQVYTVTVNGFTDTDSLQIESRVTYTDHEVTVIDASGNVSVYVLNKEGYASSCIRHEATDMIRIYSFAYSAHHSLTQMTEFINGEVVSQITLQPATAITATASLLAENGGISDTFLLTLGQANTSQLPWLYLTELYPFNLHQEAMYAHLLGKAPAQLIQSIQPEGGDEKTTYSYATDAKGNLSSCEEVISSHGTDYRRIIKYRCSQRAGQQG